MRVSKSALLSLAKVAVAAAVSVVLLIIVMNASINPARDATKSYTADFSDVSGLRTNGDVRVRGVQVGKVKGIEVVRKDGQTVAEVSFTASPEYSVTADTTLAIKYQNLTGIRYVDLVPGRGGAHIDHVGVANTKPSFDITTLFNGLEPVLQTLSTAEINTIADNALTLLQGDGTGLEPMLDSIEKLGNYAQDREKVISTLVDNLARISDSFGGKSDEIIEILHSIEIPVDAAVGVLDEFIQTSILGPQFMQPVASIIRNLGLEPDMDFNKMISDAFGTAEDFGRALRALPGTLSLIDSPTIGLGADPATLCSRGNAELPADVTMLLNGSEVTVCNP